MTHLRSLLVPSAVVLSSLVLSAPALAQDGAPPPPPPQNGAAPPPPPPNAGPPPNGAGPAQPPPPVHKTDGVRFRGAIALSGGGEFLSNFGIGMGGLEGRLGVQINNLIGVYVQPHFSVGAGTIGSVSGATGTAGVDGLVDVTLANRFFIGVGGGFGILNNPIGPDLHIRLGAYPIFGYGENGFTRKGLVVGVESRFFFLSDVTGGLTVMQLMGTIGYEVF